MQVEAASGGGVNLAEYVGAGRGACGGPDLQKAAGGDSTSTHTTYLLCVRNERRPNYQKIAKYAVKYRAKRAQYQIISTTRSTTRLAYIRAHVDTGPYGRRDYGAVPPAIGGRKYMRSHRHS